ncbi:MAG: hypothetical protein IKZ56_12180 [Bacteroidales bacterium]|nr:hypothetical protein [Bacteroidales bacterium]
MAVNQQSIDSIRLDEAFATNTYRPFNECWTVRMDSELVVIDDDEEKCSRFSNNLDDLQKALLVINKNNRQIVLLSIDNKLIVNHEGGIADCALFDDKQFHFVEFKTNAYGNSSEQVRETFDKATSQLKETIRVFRDRLQDVNVVFEDTITLSCNVVVSQRFPKSRAIKQEYQISFADENNNIPLFFPEKIFWE